MTRALITVGVIMFVVGTVYGRAGQPESSGTVDLPAALAVAPHTYPDGSLSPDYKDAAIATLRYALDSVTRDLKDLQEHDATVHRGTLVPLRYRCKGAK